MNDLPHVKSRDRRIVGGSMGWSLAVHLLGGGTVLALPLLLPPLADDVVLAGRRGMVEIQASWATPAAAMPIVEIPLTRPIVEVTPTAARIEHHRFTLVESSAARAQVEPVGHEPQDDEAGPESLDRPAPAHVSQPAPEAQPKTAPPQREPAAALPTASAAALPPEHSGVQSAEPASLADNPPPIYPLIAAQNGWHGTVLLKVRIAATGQISDVQIEKSSGHEVLDAAAVNAVRRWQAQPMRRGGQLMATQELLPIVFLPRRS